MRQLEFLFIGFRSAAGSVFAGLLVCVMACAMVCGGVWAVSAAEGGASAQAGGTAQASSASGAAVEKTPVVKAASASEKAAPQNAPAKKAAVKKKNATGKTAPATSTAKAAGTTKKAAAKKTSAKKKTAAAPAKPKTGKASAKSSGAKVSTKPAQGAAAKPVSAEKAKAATGTGATVEPPKFPASKVSPVSPQKGGQLSVAETWMPLVRRLNKDGVEMPYLRQMFGRMGDAYSHEPMGTKVKELFTNKYVEKPPRKTPTGKPSTTPPVYKSMVKPESVAKCKTYLEAHGTAFTRMEERYGVPREVVVGLLMVETRLGTYLGYNSSFWSLACMAAADSPERVDAAVQALPLPMTPDKNEWLQQILKERSTWAYKELLALIKHSKANGLDPLCMPGSVYGAVGICQFMPSNLPKYAVDGNGDGKADLFDPADAIPSVANYLVEHGWTGKDWKGKDRDVHHKTLKRYNKSNVYANTILAIADGIAAPPEPLAVAVAGAGKAEAKKPVAQSAAKKDTAKTKSGKAKGGKAKRVAKPAAKSAAKPAVKAGAKKAGAQTAKKNTAAPSPTTGAKVSAGTGAKPAAPGKSPTGAAQAGSTPSAPASAAPVPVAPVQTVPPAANTAPAPAAPTASSGAAAS